MRRLACLAAAVVGAALGAGCGSDSQRGPETPPGTLQARPDTSAAVERVLEPRRDELLGRPGVVGTGIGVTDARASRQQPVAPSERVHVIVVYLRSDEAPALPASIEGIPVKPVVTEEFRAQ